ncbi:MAG: hypothetical protein QM791_03390 [Ferruginibacter sp.]
MKRNDDAMATSISKEMMDELMTQTNETIALDCNLENDNSNFSIVDLWKLQRKQRSALDIRRRLN